MSSITIKAIKNAVNNITAIVMPQADFRSGQRTCLNSLHAPLK